MNGTIELRASSAYGRHYIWGAVWPHGREAAQDAAQVRILERELQYITTHGTEESAA